MTNNPGRALALDVGDARIGVALSDPLRMLAKPFTTVERTGRKELRILHEMIIEQEVTLIVIGMPYELDGEIGAQGMKVKQFMKALEEELSGDRRTKEIAITTLDERFTTVEAERFLLGSKRKNKERRAERDSIAAALILEQFLTTN